MERGLWSPEPTEVPSPQTSFTTRLASKENINFCHLVNEDTDRACLLLPQETDCEYVNRAGRQHHLVDADVSASLRTPGNNNQKVNITAKVILLATTFQLHLNMFMKSPVQLQQNTFYLSPGKADSSLGLFQMSLHPTAVQKPPLKLNIQHSKQECREINFATWYRKPCGHKSGYDAGSCITIKGQ